MRTIYILMLIFIFFSCQNSRNERQNVPDTEIVMVDPDTPQNTNVKLESDELNNTRTLGNSGLNPGIAATMQKAELPQSIITGILTDSALNGNFITDLNNSLQGDHFLRILVDKQNALPHGYAPTDIVPLRNGGSYQVSRNDLSLRRVAAAALEEMAAAARADGITLVVASSYRSFDYQTQVYNRYVNQMGQAAADRISARPGHSQHQLGMVVDFGPIDNSFAQSPAGRWVAANASRFGWSLSYPQNFETITGYSWESWHYRYVGRNLAAFIDRYFEGIQQHALRFIHEWEQI
ncbi:MAG: M15 family metallopeptidase [Treponema sp.]|nr:M15 family metallopeptidase [Treponema sp.]